MKIYEPTADIVYDACYDWMGIVQCTDGKDGMHISESGTKELWRLLRDVRLVLVDNELVDEMAKAITPQEDYVKK